MELILEGSPKAKPAPANSKTRHSQAGVKFSSYSDYYPLGPEGYFFTSTKNLRTIKSMSKTYLTSTIRWVEKTFSPRDTFAVDKLVELKRELASK